MKRNANVEFARFIGAIMIMATHLASTGVELGRYVNGFIYVEFFLMLTGGYTAKHFEKINTINKCKESVLYTKKKFLPLIPYTTIATLFVYLLYIIVNAINGTSENILNIQVYLFGNFWTDLFLWC